MDPPEQALVEVGAAPLAAPSAAVAGLVAALKRLDAVLAGQDLTDASLSIYLARLHAAGLSPAVAAMAVAAVKFRCRLLVGASKTDQEGRGAVLRPRRRRSRAPAVGQRHPPNHPQPGHYARGQLAARGAVARVRYGRG